MMLGIFFALISNIPYAKSQNGLVWSKDFSDGVFSFSLLIVNHKSEIILHYIDVA